MKVNKRALDYAIEVARVARRSYLNEMRSNQLPITEIVDNDTHLCLIINLATKLLAGEKIEVEE